MKSRKKLRLWLRLSCGLPNGRKRWRQEVGLKRKAAAAQLLQKTALGPGDAARPVGADKAAHHMGNLLELFNIHQWVLRRNKHPPHIQRCSLSPMQVRGTASHQSVDTARVSQILSAESSLRSTVLGRRFSCLRQLRANRHRPPTGSPLCGYAGWTRSHEAALPRQAHL